MMWSKVPYWQTAVQTKTNGHHAIYGTTMSVQTETIFSTYHLLHSKRHYKRWQTETIFCKNSLYSVQTKSNRNFLNKPFVLKVSTNRDHFLYNLWNGKSLQTELLFRVVPTLSQAIALDGRWASWIRAHYLQPWRPRHLNRIQKAELFHLWWLIQQDQLLHWLGHPQWE